MQTFPLTSSFDIPTTTASMELKIIDEKILTFGLPEYALAGDAGLGLRACIDAPIILHPEETVLIPTGIAIHIKNPNLVGKMYPRSGLGHKHGIVLGNLTGIVDSSYQGQIYVSLWNRNTHIKQETAYYVIEPGDIIAQLVITPVIHASFIRVDEFETVSERAVGGFGHTGRS